MGDDLNNIRAFTGRRTKNRPFPSCPKPKFQSRANYEAILI